MKSVYVYPPKLMADAVLSQANPVSTTLYEVLATTKNVRIIHANANVTWATTQPTPLEIVITVDGNTLIFQQTNPISTQRYRAVQVGDAEATQKMVVVDSGSVDGSAPTFLLEGRSVRVQIRITWATTQPTPLVCRVKYAKY